MAHSSPHLSQGTRNSGRWNTLPVGWYGLHVGLPLLVGGMIYILWRPTHLWMFDWFETLHLAPALDYLRTAASPYRSALPDWTVNSLPNALWVYALASCMIGIWRNASLPVISAALGVAFVLGIGAECAQAVDLCPGTFDLVDLGLSLAAFTLAIIGQYFILDLSLSSNSIRGSDS